MPASVLGSVSVCSSNSANATSVVTVAELALLPTTALFPDFP